MTSPSDPTELPTPALVVDVKTVRRNIAKMADYARAHRLNLRPHAKTHKSIRVGRMQIEAGAIGLAVAKPGEAAVMAEAANDLMVAYPAFDAFRTPVLMKLAAAGKTIRVAVDSREAVDRLADAASEKIGILVDLDVGFHRTGVQSPTAATELAKYIAQHNRVRLDGIMIFPGHVFSRAAEQQPALEAISALLDETLGQWSRAGLKADIVSGGSTPSAMQSHAVRGLTEIRPGTYAYYDANCVAGGWCSLDDCAARMTCTVVSTAVPSKCVIDAGSKTLTSDRRFDAPDKAGFGYVVELPNAKISRLSEEHGEIELNGEPPPKIGQRLTVIPNHICPCVNLHDRFWFREEDGRLTESRVDARGKVQ